tara:strand:+ start:1807 stop:1986 length:180 start_codon:yes stop_codon:yes gene_type:complete
MYYPILIKDKTPNVKGEKYGPVDIESYKILYNNGFIEDDMGLIKKKNTKKKTEDNEKND